MVPLVQFYWVSEILLACSPFIFALARIAGFREVMDGKRWGSHGEIRRSLCIRRPVTAAVFQRDIEEDAVGKWYSGVSQNYLISTVINKNFRQYILYVKLTVFKNETVNSFEDYSGRIRIIFSCSRNFFLLYKININITAAH